MEAKYLESERKDGEIFLFNSSVDTPLKEWEIPFKTLRRGDIALNIHGDKLDFSYQPVFINKNEFNLYDKTWKRYLGYL